MMDDDVIFWRGIPVACMEGGRLVFLPGAPREAVEELSRG